MKNNHTVFRLKAIGAIACRPTIACRPERRIGSESRQQSGAAACPHGLGAAAELNAAPGNAVAGQSSAGKGPISPGNPAARQQQQQGAGRALDARAPGPPRPCPALPVGFPARAWSGPALPCAAMRCNAYAP